MKDLKEGARPQGMPRPFTGRAGHLKRGGTSEGVPPESKLFENFGNFCEVFSLVWILLKPLLADTFTSCSLY
jgi:hypothetical protein